MKIKTGQGIIKINIKFLIIMLSGLLLLISCSEQKAYIAFYTGSVTIRKPGGTTAGVRVKDRVNDGDILKTGKKSCIIIQNTEGLIIRFEQNTEAQIISFNNPAKKGVSLNRGKVLSNVSKLKKGGEYYVKTPTTVASVRGTEFLTTFNGKYSTVAVGDGKVSVKKIDVSGNENIGKNEKNYRIGNIDKIDKIDKIKKNKDNEEKIVEKGFTAVIGKKSIVRFRKTNRIEKLELSKIKKTPGVETIEKKTTEEMNEIFKETEKKDKKINDQIKEITGLTPGEMRAMYGRIDTLSLYDGRVLQGVIASRGSVYKILTQSGIMMVDSKDIKGTETRR